MNKSTLCDVATVVVFVAICAAPCSIALALRVFVVGQPLRFFENVDGSVRTAVAEMRGLGQEVASVGEKAFDNGDWAGVVRGGRRWLFLTSGGEMQVYTGRLPLNRGVVERWRSVLERRRELCDRHGAFYLPLICPDKHSVHEEKLPDDIRLAKGRSQLDQWCEILAESEVRWLDIRAALIMAKKNEDVYYPDDTHWNHNGAYAAYAAVMSMLRECGVEGIVLGADEFIQGSRGRIGDLLPDEGRDTGVRQFPVWERKGGWRAVSSTYHWPEGVEKPSRVEPWQVARVYECEAAAGVLLLVGDSFTQVEEHLFVKLVADSFKRCIVISNTPGASPSCGAIERVVEFERPDVFIESRVERQLSIVFSECQ